MNSSVDLVKIAQQSRQASSGLVSLGPQGRGQILSQLSVLIAKRKDDILEANTLDLEASREMAVPDVMLDWLRLTPERIRALSQILDGLANSPDPLHQFSKDTYYVNTAKTYCQRMPLGVLALLYESFPELGAIAAGLCIKSGNALILKGGAEASHSNQMITAIIQEHLAETGADSQVIHLLPTDQQDVTRELLTLNPHIQLLIPYGRPNLVQRVMKQATVPILKTAIGNCYLYCSDSASADAVVQVAVDSAKGEPDLVNAIDKLLIHDDCPLTTVAQLLDQLRSHHYVLKGDEAFVEGFANIELASTQEWSQPLWNSTILLKRVHHIEAAVQWINHHSFGRSSCIMTDSYQESQYFIDHIASAMVYVNTSPRFQRYPKGGAIALGMAIGSSYGSGPIMAHHLTVPKQVVCA